jgi:HlyD family secretion protein
MDRRRIAVPVLVLALAAGGFFWLRGGSRPAYYTGFVEGEERVIRSEVAGRVLEIRFGEGDRVPAGAVIARLDAADVASRIASKEREIAMLDAEIRRGEEQLSLVERTWKEDVAARAAEVRQAAAAADLARRTYEREKSLTATGASTAQLLDEMRSRNDQAGSGLDRSKDLLARAHAEEGQIAVARQSLEVARERRALAAAQLDELRVLHAKYEIRAPAAETVVQTQLLWAGELAQPGTAVLSLLDPLDKYVQIYVPSGDLAALRPGRRVEIELDGMPGARIPGEISFVADSASFTPEKIETRSDRLGQVYRAKVRILEGAERLQAGAEGNVYLLDDGDGSADGGAAGERRG